MRKVECRRLPPPPIPFRPSSVRSIGRCRLTPPHGRGRRRSIRCCALRSADGPASYVSVFAGRIADTGRDPVPMMVAAVEILKPHPRQELIWASPRELLNIFQADAIGCHVITVTHDLLKKLTLVGKDLAEYSLVTLKMIHDDASHAGYSL